MSTPFNPSARFHRMNRIWEALQRDEPLKSEIAALFPAQDGADPKAAADQMIRLLSTRIRGAVSDQPSEDRSKYISGLVTDLMADKVLRSFIK